MKFMLKILITICQRRFARHKRLAATNLRGANVKIGPPFKIKKGIALVGLYEPLWFDFQVKGGYFEV